MLIMMSERPISFVIVIVILRHSMWKPLLVCEVEDIFNQDVSYGDILARRVLKKVPDAEHNTTQQNFARVFHSDAMISKRCSV